MEETAQAIFPSDKKYRRPVVVSKTWSLGFIPYKDKGIKLPDLLRRNRTHLPELLLALDRTGPLNSGPVQAQAQCSGRSVGLTADCSLQTKIKGCVES